MERTGPAGPRVPLRWLSRAALAVAATTTAIVIAQAQTLDNPTQVLLVVAASVAYLVMLA